MFGSTAGLTTVTLPGRSPSGPVMRAGRPTLIEHRFLHRNVGARHHLRDIDDRNHAAYRWRGDLARINRPIRHDAADGTPDLRVGKLHRRRCRSAPWPRSPVASAPRIASLLAHLVQRLPDAAAPRRTGSAPAPSRPSRRPPASARARLRAATPRDCRRASSRRRALLLRGLHVGFAPLPFVSTTVAPVRV